MNIREVGAEELQQCPAAVTVDEKGVPTFLVNRETFPTAGKFSQKFYLAHELGHYLLSTSDEEAADAFALSALAGTERKSLKKSIETLYHVEAIPYERMLSLYNLALQIDNFNNLNPLLTMKHKIWNNKKDEMFFGRLDGDETVETPTTTQSGSVVAAANALGDIIGGNNRRRAGLRINNVFFPLESILLTGILIMLVIVCCKK